MSNYKKGSYIYKGIKNCRSCKNPNLIDILDLGKIPIPNFGNSNEEREAPLRLVFCPKCKLLQLKETVNPVLLWNENYGYQSGINRQMVNELKEIVRRIEKTIKLKKEVVLDIGCNDGTLLKLYKQKNLTRVGFDPSGNVIKIAKNRLRKFKKTILIKNFFSAKEYLEKVKIKAKVITAIAMFYDLNNPNKFLRDVKRCLDENGIFIIQQNYLPEMIKQNALDNIVHEHLEYYSITSLKDILERNGFEIFDIEFNQTNGGSFRTYIKNKGNQSFKIKKKKIERLIKKELEFGIKKKETYQKFKEKVTENLNKLKEFLKNERKKGKKIFIYGASTRGNTLVNYIKLDKEIIEKAVDKNPFKLGKRIAGTNIKIISERQARKENPDYFLILPWYFRDEFIRRERRFLEKGRKLIFPLPKLEIYQTTSPTKTQ